MGNYFKPIDFPDKTFPVSIDWSRRTEPHSKLHSHSKEIEIHYVIDGEGTYLVENRLHKVAEGAMLIIHSNELHRLAHIKEGKPLNKICLIFSPPIFTRYGDFMSYLRKHLFRCYPGFKHLLYFRGSSMVEIECLLRLIYNEFQKKRLSWKDLIITQLVRLGIIIQRASMSLKGEQEFLGKDTVMEKVLSYIDKNIAADINLPILSVKANLSSNYLSYKFKKVVGVNIREYIIAKRINEAKKRLEREPETKIISIAIDIGFKDLSHFNHTFKKNTGFTPSGYRKICQTNLI